MSSAECLREFVNERLSAADEEIFGVFQKTIVEYEEEISRQHRLLDIFWKPQVKLFKIELPQQHVCKEEEDITDQQLCNEERSSSLGQEDPKPPQIKEEHEELCISQEGEQLELKLETDINMLTPTCEESDHSGPELNSDHQLLSNNSHVAESQYQKGDKPEDSSTRDAEPKNKFCKSKRRTDSPSISKTYCSTLKGKKSFKCESVSKTLSQLHRSLTTMSSFECLREFVNERLSAAAEEIFGVFQKTIVEYEEEINRQHRLLDIFWKPQVKLHRIKLPQQHVCKEEEDLTDQQLCNEERSSSLDQEDPEPPQIKEEQEDLCTSQEGDQLKLKQETDTFMLTPTCEESDHSEPELNSDHQLLSNNSHVAESQDQKEGEQEDSGLTRNAKPKNRLRKSKRRTDSPIVAKTDCSTHTGKRSFKCESCGKDFKCKSKLQVHQRGGKGVQLTYCKTCEKDFRCVSEFKVHMRTHTGEKPYSCETCGKSFNILSVMKIHITMHTGEKPYSCKTCGKIFRRAGDLKVHMKIHSGEKPHSCNTCGKRFSRKSELNVHIRTHTGEKPYSCDTCGKKFFRKSELNTHMSSHTGEKPYNCTTCGKDFRFHSRLKVHMITHTGEKPHHCKACGERFFCKSILKRHMRTHTDEKPHSCKTCGKNFRFGSDLKVHMRLHTGEKPYVCKRCERCFRYSSALSLHMRKAHTS